MWLENFNLRLVEDCLYIIILSFELDFLLVPYECIFSKKVCFKYQYTGICAFEYCILIAVFGFCIIFSLISTGTASTIFSRCIDYFAPGLVLNLVDSTCLQTSDCRKHLITFFSVLKQWVFYVELSIWYVSISLYLFRSGQCG